MQGREVTLCKNKLACSALVDDDVIEVIATEQIHVIVVSCYVESIAPPALVDATGVSCLSFTERWP